MSTPYLAPSYFAPTYFPPDYWGGEGSAPSLASFPNPNETVWNLGYREGAWDGTIVTNYALGLSTTLLNNGTPVTFPSGAVLDALVWPGNSLSTTFVPVVAWDTPNGGYANGVILLSITATQSAMLSEGNYRFQVGVTIAGTRYLVYDGNLLVKETVGTNAPATPWCSLQDMLNESVQVQSLYDQAEDATGFLNERSYVTYLVSRDIVVRYQPMVGFTKTRQPVADPIVGFDVPDPTFDAITKAILTAQLGKPLGLILEARIRKIVACKANALVLGRQVGNRAYMEDAAIQEMKAMEIWRTYQAQVDLQATPTGLCQALVDMNCIFIPAGQAP